MAGSECPDDGNSATPSPTTSTNTILVAPFPPGPRLCAASTTSANIVVVPFPPGPRLCAACGSPIDRSPSSDHDPCGTSSSSSSDPPVLSYRPLRAPAINIPNRSAAKEAIIHTPVPQPQPVTVVTLPHSFVVPVKRISTPDDIQHFHASSPSGANFLGFVAALSHSTLRRKISDPLATPLSPALVSLLSLLQTFSRWVDDIPGRLQEARFGDPAFRDWHGRLVREAEPLMVSQLLSPHELEPAALELLPYLIASFGNPDRMDYGTGHEASFAAFLYCLARLGLLKEEDYQGVALRVFVDYLNLTRKLQTTYRLEPAGSHGVWGLDDYHFLPFIFGAAQLVDHKYMKPKSIHNQDILDGFSNDYLYLACVAYVRKVKKGPFAEHSPLLDDISAVPNWNKVHGGLLKMFKAEVLEKVPLMQHFLFGSLITWE